MSLLCTRMCFSDLAFACFCCVAFALRVFLRALAPCALFAPSCIYHRPVSSVDPRHGSNFCWYSTLKVEIPPKPRFALSYLILSYHQRRVHPMSSFSSMRARPLCGRGETVSRRLVVVRSSANAMVAPGSLILVAGATGGVGQLVTAKLIEVWWVVNT